MKALYEKLATKLQTNARERGKNKGRAPAQKDWAMSGHKSYLEWQGTDIVGHFEKTDVFRITKEGLLTIHTGGYYEYPLTRAYLWDVLNITVQSKTPKSRSCTVLTLPNGAGGYSSYLFYDGIQIQENKVVSPLRPFPGIRVDKTATAKLRARFQCVYDALPMFHLAHSGLAPSGRNFTGYDNKDDLAAVLDVEAEIENILSWVLKQTTTSRWDWRVGRSDVTPSTLEKARAFLNRQLSVYEDYISDVYVA